MTFREYIDIIEFIIIIIGGSCYLFKTFGEKIGKYWMKPWLWLRIASIITYISVFHTAFYLLGNGPVIIRIVDLLSKLETGVFLITFWGYLLQAWIQLRVEENYYMIKTILILVFWLISPIFIWSLLKEWNLI